MTPLGASYLLITAQVLRIIMPDSHVAPDTCPHPIGSNCQVLISSILKCDFILFSCSVPCIPFLAGCAIFQPRVRGQRFYYDPPYVS